MAAALGAGALRKITMRTFLDRDGVEWQVWQVVPDSRLLLDRRIMDSGRPLPPEADDAMRARLERRRGDLRNGWLCFLHGDERRRLYPVPADWESYSEARLELLWRAAAEVRSPLSRPPRE